MPLANRPLHRELFWPTLRAIQELGGSATRREVLAKVASDFSEDEQAEMMPNGRESRLNYYTSWNLTHLKQVGAIANSTQGVWSLTERGREITEERADALWEEVPPAYRRRRQQRQAVSEPSDLSVEEASVDDVLPGSDDWKDALLAHLRSLAPAGFERLCQRLLREEGVERVEVVGGAGDQGIDGAGVARLGLLSFPVYFQAKRYTQPVTPSAVRDFRGTMAGRGEKGLIITTASFTPAAYREATRDGVAPIDLVDGDELCNLLKKHSVGVIVRQVEEITVDEAFWTAFE